MRDRDRPVVLHIAQPVEGGVARVVTDLVREQARAGLRPLVACPPEGPLPPSAAAAGAGVLPWPATRAPGARLPQEALRLARLVRLARPDLVHAHSAKAGLAGRLAVRGRIPTVFQPHAWSFEAVDGAAAALALRWERYAARWADRVVCVSEDERRRGEHAGVSARWAVVRNGTDLVRFRPVGAADRAGARAALGGLPATVPLVVCVGRLCRQKGQDVLLRAWPAVVARVPGARLVLVGDGPDREALRALAPADVVFAGATGEVTPWYAAADLVVLPSRWEGMALAPLEAMACGRAVVTCEVTGARESLPPGDAVHCLVPPEDPPALARAVTGLLRDPALRTELGERGRRHVAAAHDVRETAAAVSRLYRDLLDEAVDGPPRGPDTAGTARGRAAGRARRSGDPARPEDPDAPAGPAGGPAGGTRGAADRAPHTAAGEKDHPAGRVLHTAAGEKDHPAGRGARDGARTPGRTTARTGGGAGRHAAGPAQPAGRGTARGDRESVRGGDPGTARHTDGRERTRR